MLSTATAWSFITSPTLFPVATSQILMVPILTG